MILICKINVVLLKIVPFPADFFLYIFANLFYVIRGIVFFFFKRKEINNLKSV